MTTFEVIILAIIEGLTEFLPVSSTGHLIIASSFMNIQSDDFHKAFEVIIQFGAVLAVLSLYLKKLLASRELIKKIIIAFLPAAFFGFLLKDIISQLMESPTVVAISLILGGFVFIKLDNFQRQPQKQFLEFTIPETLILGLWQCLALIPGVSRSGATLFGGLVLRLSRAEAVEVSFLLALPTIGAATAYKFLKIQQAITSEQIYFLTLGSIVSFIVALFAVKFFIHFVSRHGFKYFGYYRIILGVIVLAVPFLQRG